MNLPQHSHKLPIIPSYIIENHQTMIKWRQCGHLRFRLFNICSYMFPYVPIYKWSFHHSIGTIISWHPHSRDRLGKKTRVGRWSGESALGLREGPIGKKNITTNHNIITISSQHHSQLQYYPYILITHTTHIYVYDYTCIYIYIYMYI